MGIVLRLKGFFASWWVESSQIKIFVFQLWSHIGQFNVCGCLVIRSYSRINFVVVLLQTQNSQKGTINVNPSSQKPKINKRRTVFLNLYHSSIVCVCIVKWMQFTNMYWLRTFNMYVRFWKKACLIEKKIKPIIFCLTRANFSKHIF